MYYPKGDTKENSYFFHHAYKFYQIVLILIDVAVIYM